MKNAKRNKDITIIHRYVLCMFFNCELFTKSNTRAITFTTTGMLSFKFLSFITTPPSSIWSLSIIHYPINIHSYVSHTTLFDNPFMHIDVILKHTSVV